MVIFNSYVKLPEGINKKPALNWMLYHAGCARMMPQAGPAWLG
jgi:hypothetical protein